MTFKVIEKKRFQLLESIKAQEKEAAKESLVGGRKEHNHLQELITKELKISHMNWFQILREKA